jgi:hypothetical protein
MHAEPIGWLTGSDVIEDEALMTALMPRIDWK